MTRQKLFDWTLVLIAFIGAVPATGAAIVGIMTLRATEHTYHQINSRMDELLEVTTLQQRALAVKEERERVKAGRPIEPPTGKPE